MKKILHVVSLVLLTVPLSGQVIYPLTIIVGWDRNPSTEAVIDYTLVHNNGTGNQTFTILDSACTNPIADGQCRQAISVPGAGLQTVSIVVRNLWGSSVPEVVTFSATAPGKARNIKIRVGN